MFNHMVLSVHNVNIPMISSNVFVTMNVQVQLKPVATEAAEPRIFAGRISPIINQGIGPKPKLKLSTKTTKLPNGNQPIVETSPPASLT